MKPFIDSAVEAHFNAYPAHVHKKMLVLRDLLFKVAAETAGVGEIQETLKWGEPAYVTAATKSGSTIRMDWKSKQPEQLALYFNCHTTLVDTFRTIFQNDFNFEGNRAIVFDVTEDFPMDALAFCIGAALTYHAQKKSGNKNLTAVRPK